LCDIALPLLAIWIRLFGHATAFFCRQMKVMTRCNQLILGERHQTTNLVLGSKERMGRTAKKRSAMARRS
ncbi:hypothetical protein KCU64_g92, partial [Aureobasidium melanogenum]